MEMDIYKIINDYGIKGVIAVASVYIILSILKSKKFLEWWSKKTDAIIEWAMKRKVNESKHEIKESDILNHDIFNYIDFWRYSKIPTFTFSTEYRTVIFKKYLNIFLKHYKKGIEEFISKKEYQNMDQSQLWKSLLDLINNIVMNYEDECESVGIPKVIILKMKSKNNDTIMLTIDLIESISNSQFYVGDKNYLKVYSILNILLSILENTISNSNSVCNSINGQLKGLYIVENNKKIIEP